jgi:branched-chain amino acid transport system substrate-binding protein
MVNGIKLALARRTQGRPVHVKYTSLDDATAAGGRVGSGPDGGERTQGRRRPEHRLLHRRVQLGRSEVSIPILNNAGIPQVSPANTYVGLTTDEPGVSAPGEPEKYYPTGNRTYLRIVADRLDLRRRAT